MMMVRFPETEEEARLWKPTIRVEALGTRVLAVAVTRIEGKWKAYIGAVPGHDHDNEWQAVRVDGRALMKEVACAVFPEVAEIPYAR